MVKGFDEISAQSLQYLAGLIGLDLDVEQIEKLQGDLESILANARNLDDVNVRERIPAIVLIQPNKKE